MGRIFFFISSFAVGYGLAEEVFDLAVHAAQVVGGPFFQRLEQVGRDAQQEGLTVSGCHGSVVEGAGVDDRRDLALGA